MPKKKLTQEDLRARLNKIVDSCKSQKEAALRLGISQQYLCDILYGRRLIGGRILQSIGVREVKYWERVKP